VLYGDQLRQAWLDDWIHHGLLGVGAPPDGPPHAAAAQALSEGTEPGTQARP
jgi:hypothetical protein